MSTKPSLHDIIYSVVLREYIIEYNEDVYTSKKIVEIISHTVLKTIYDYFEGFDTYITKLTLDLLYAKIRNNLIKHNTTFLTEFTLSNHSVNSHLKFCSETTKHTIMALQDYSKKLTA